MGVLEANAEFDGVPETVSLRVARAPSQSSYFLDLADREGRVIEIRPDGWELVSEPLVFFRRAAGQHALPLPAQGGSLELLKKYLSVEEIDWPLFIEEQNRDFSAPDPSRNAARPAQKDGRVTRSRHR